MIEEAKDGRGAVKDITDDLLLCNRCGTCKSVCPLFNVFREEWAGARGKVELAEAFFRGERVDEKKLRGVFELCLHCMTCRENCPSGMRADDVVMAVRAEMARRGLIPRFKRYALRALEEMDNRLFKVMRMLKLSRSAPLHGVGGKSPLSFLFPLLGWPRERFVPLPKDRPFLETGGEMYRAGDVEAVFPEPAAVRNGDVSLPEAIDADRAADLLERVIAARDGNLSSGRTAYFFVGHTVNHFFPEEAETLVTLLNLFGIDVIVPKDQLCCGAPFYYAGDIENARRAAYRALERFTGYHYDMIVTSCASGGMMLKSEFPRLFDLTQDGYFEITWDTDMEAFRRVPGPGAGRRKFPQAAGLYDTYINGKVFDINELIARVLGYQGKPGGFRLIFGGSGRDERPDTSGKAPAGDTGLLVVTYHHPCHLKRGQSVEWQPEVILEHLPGHEYVRMRDADVCCGGGGTFTFQYAEVSDKIARAKVDAIEALGPDIVATACPLCRIQLMDMIRRHFDVEAGERGEERRKIPVMTPAELLLEDLTRIVPLKQQ